MESEGEPREERIVGEIGGMDDGAEGRRGGIPLDGLMIGEPRREVVDGDVEDPELIGEEEDSEGWMPPSRRDARSSAKFTSN